MSALPISPRGGEIRALTGLRGVAAMYVVMLHFTMGLPLGPFTYVALHGYLAVDLFFVLSGFVMAMVYASDFANGFTVRRYARFIGKRLGRVYPLYLVTTLACLFLSLGLDHQTFPVKTIVTNLLLINEWGLAPSINPPAWSISAEFAAYLLFPALLLLATRGGRRQAIAVGIVATGALIWLSTLTDVQPSGYPKVEPPIYCTIGFYWYGPLPIIRCIAEFTLGLIAYRISRNPLNDWDRSRLGRNAADIAGATILVLLPVFGLDAAIVLLFVVMIVGLVRRPSFLGRVLASPSIHWLGVISYSLYLIHIPVLLFGRDRVQTLLASSGVPHAYTLSYPVVALLTVILSPAAYYGIEKPARDFSRRWLKAGAQPIEAEPSAP